MYVVVLSLLPCWFVEGDVLVDFVKVINRPDAVVAVDVVLEVFVELGVDCVVNVLAHRSEETVDNGPFTVENFDGVVGGAKFCG